MRVQGVDSLPPKIYHKRQRHDSVWIMPRNPGRSLVVEEIYIQVPKAEKGGDSQSPRCSVSINIHQGYRRGLNREVMGPRCAQIAP